MAGLKKNIALFTLASIAMFGVGKAMPVHAALENANMTSVTSSRLDDEQAREALINNVGVSDTPVAATITPNLTLSRRDAAVIRVTNALRAEVLNLMNGR